MADFRFRASENKSPPAAASTSVRSTDQPLQDDSLHAELLKLKIKEQIMIREIASRRMQEAEIRIRELLLEQELAKRRAESRSEGLSIDDLFPVRLLDQIRMNHIVDPPSVPGSSSSLPVLPFPDLQNEEPKPSDDQNNKFIILPKPDPANFERKRKAEGELAAVTATTTAKDDDDETTIIPIKKLAMNEEFLCNLCNVTASTRISFTAHLKGKRHMAKEQRAGLQVVQTQEPNPVEVLKQKTDHPEKNKSFKFWCEICEIGTPCKAIMISHNNGRKHKARLLKLSQQPKLDDQKN